VPVFAAQVANPVGGGAWWDVAGDFNGDGRLDLAVSTTVGAGVLLNQAPPTPPSNPGVPAIVTLLLTTPTTPTAPQSPPPAPPALVDLLLGNNSVSTVSPTVPGQSPVGPSGSGPGHANGAATVPVVVAAAEVLPVPREMPPAVVTPTPTKPVVAVPTQPTTPTPAPANPAAAPPVATRTALFPPQTPPPPFAVDFLRQQLDSIPDPEQQHHGAEPQTIAVPAVALAGGLTVGYVLFYSRVAYLLLSLMSAGSVWREIDPVAFLEYWEEEGRKNRADDGEKKTEAMFD